LRDLFHLDSYLSLLICLQDSTLSPPKSLFPSSQSHLCKMLIKSGHSQIYPHFSLLMILFKLSDHGCHTSVGSPPTPPCPSVRKMQSPVNGLQDPVRPSLLPPSPCFLCSGFPPCSSNTVPLQRLCTGCTLTYKGLPHTAFSFTSSDL
jgi:hypothetical protein